MGRIWLDTSFVSMDASVSKTIRDLLLIQVAWSGHPVAAVTPSVSRLRAGLLAYPNVVYEHPHVADADVACHQESQPHLRLAAEVAKSRHVTEIEGRCHPATRIAGEIPALVGLIIHEGQPTEVVVALFDACPVLQGDLRRRGIGEVERAVGQPTVQIMGIVVDA